MTTEFERAEAELAEEVKKAQKAVASVLVDLKAALKRAETEITVHFHQIHACSAIATAINHLQKHPDAKPSASQIVDQGNANKP
jgi:hypothetical protein